MPVGFLSENQRQRYGQYVGELTPAQLARYFLLDDMDRKLISKRRDNHNRLGFALQLSTVRFLGTFLTDPTVIPLGVVAYIAQQLAIVDLNCLVYYHKSQTWWDHVREICQQYGYRNFSQQPEHWQFVRWLYNRAWFSDESPSILFDHSTAYRSSVTLSRRKLETLLFGGLWNSTRKEIH